MTRIMFHFLVALIISCGALQPQHIYAQQPQKAENKQQVSIPRYKGYSEPLYKEITTSALYVTMRDGTKIAIDVLLPKDLPANTKIPAVMHITRYWRA